MADSSAARPTVLVTGAGGRTGGYSSVLPVASDCDMNPSSALSSTSFFFGGGGVLEQTDDSGIWNLPVVQGSCDLQYMLVI